MAFHGRGAEEDSREQEVERVHSSPLTPSAETVHIARRAFSEDLHGTFFARAEFTCKICLMQCDDRVKTTLSQCAAPQAHAVCRDCLRCYLQGRIEERRVKDLRCPLFGSDCCQAVAQEHELSSILPEEARAASGRLPRMMGAGAEADLEANGADEVLALNPEMLCSQGHVFCYYHSNAHPPGQGACEAYAREEAREAKLAMEAQGAKECPHCKAHTLKADGCNHMVCFACQSHWCWTCGKLLDGRLSLGWHYNPANPAGCLQFSALESKDMSSKLTLLARLFALRVGHLLNVYLVEWSEVGEKRQLRIPPSEGYGQGWQAFLQIQCVSE
ncbi:hypothetical protein AK812_SmicGene13331 [Symbiodinium microadriaticum]|uniref:RING-type domain-containing protein n=1 Tax=Symbiodinium microadriaticum TaxID=2951 RepID=A0A1Q9E8F0_SYMMI|nr:hypothetical protein AK812_SmicGene13331 [Symbiodinium microadriaticum]